MFLKRGRSAQSALEYLSTYSWAIIILIVALLSLYKLGVFSSLTTAPRSQPGACQVIRPNGPNSTLGISISGTCFGLLPALVPFMNGYSSNIVTNRIFPVTGTQVTEIVWVYPVNFVSGGTPVIVLSTTLGDGLLITNLGNAEFGIRTKPSAGLVQALDSNTVLHFNNWHMLSGTYNGMYLNVCVDATNCTAVASASGLQNEAVAPLQIGSASGLGPPYTFNGVIVNVQIYNTSLSQNTITTLYREGMGGAPLDLNNLVGWWPLNGNANDYSGDNWNATTNNVAFTGTISNYVTT